MKTFKFTIAALCGAHAYATSLMGSTNPVTTSPTPAQRLDYPEWALAMEDYENEYAWEPYTVETDDGYILTMFKVFKRNYTGQTESILFQQGYGLDAQSILEQMNELWPNGEKHHWFKAIDEGYDIWFNNFRGTRYSLEHQTLSNKSREYWNFSFPELGKYDTPAAIETIYEENGNQKIYLINQSNATTAMHYGLQYEDDEKDFKAEEDFYAERLHKVIQLTPCAGIVNQSAFTNDVDIGVEFLNEFLESKVYYVGGPDWGTTDEQGSQAFYLCQGYKFLQYTKPELPEPEGVCNLLNEFGSGQAISIVMQMHYTQNSEVGRFQEFIEPNDWITGNKRESDLINLKRINKVPIEYFAHVDDELCPYNVMLDMYKAIKSPIVLRQYNGSIGPEGNHQDVTGLNNNSKWYSQMEQALQPVDSMTKALWSQQKTLIKQVIKQVDLVTKAIPKIPASQRPSLDKIQELKENAIQSLSNAFKNV